MNVKRNAPSVINSYKEIVHDFKLWTSCFYDTMTLRIQYFHFKTNCFTVYIKTLLDIYFIITFEIMNLIKDMLLQNFINNFINWFRL